MSVKPFPLDQAARDLRGASPQEILKYALARHPDATIAFSGAEDVVLIDMASRLLQGSGREIKAFVLETGRLHAQTYRFLETVRNRFPVDIEFLYPDRQDLETLTRKAGLFSFYENGHKECCAIRKVGPLKRKLSTVGAWVTGQRRDQSTGTRDSLPVVQNDVTFGVPESPLVKYNPLAGWTSAQVWQYIHDNDVPYNELHAQGYVSIGCEPCTRPVLPAQQEREGRWWWEDAQTKECGLHAGNLRVARG